MDWMAGCWKVLPIIRVIAPPGQQAERQHAAETFQIVQVDILRHAGGVKRDDLDDLRRDRTVQIPVEQLVREKGARRRDGQLDARVRPGQLVGQHHAQQGLHVGRTRKDRALARILPEVHQQPGLLKGGRGKVEVCQILEHFADDLARASDALPLKLRVIVIAEALFLARRQAQMIDQCIERVIRENPLPGQCFGQRGPLHTGQPRERRYGHFLGFQQLPQVFAEQQHGLISCWSDIGKVYHSAAPPAVPQIVKNPAHPVSQAVSRRGAWLVHSPAAARALRTGSAARSPRFCA